MHTLIDDNKPFITLLACPNCPVLVSSIIGSSLVLTETEQETSALIANKLFNLLIIDIALNGFGLISLAKSPNSINACTPILALVDKDEPEQRKTLIEAGFDDCLLKPLTAVKLNEAIELWGENDVLAVYLESTQTLLAILKGKKDVVQALYSKLFEELPQQISQLKAGLDNKEQQTAFEAAHKITNSARICHLNGIEKLALPLEYYLKQKKYDLAEGYFSMLSESIDKLMGHRHAILHHLEGITVIKKAE